MTEEQKQALIEWLKPQIDELQNVSDEIPFGLDADSAMHLNTMRVAIAALTAQPVKLPDNVPCKGSPQFVWLQVNCDTGNPSEWPEHPGAGVTWHTEQIHSDDVLYIRANNYEVQE